MPSRERVVAQPPASSSRLAIPETLESAQPLLAPLAGAWLTYVALGALLQSPAFRVYAAGLLPQSVVLSAVTSALSPDRLLEGSRSGAAGLMVFPLYAVIASLAIASWCWGVRLAQRLDGISLGTLLVTTVALATPLLVLPGLFSDDVYLYNLYGRTISAYGENPIITPPSAFPYDPHLPWVHWPDVLAAYGPLWLMLSAVLSGLAGDSITAAILAYRFAGLGLHLATASALWLALRGAGPSRASRTLLYAWNPLILVEVVGNAHNDVLVALLAVLLVVAAAERTWLVAVFFGACAVMVKPFAALLFPPLVREMCRSTSGDKRVRRIAEAGLVAAVVAIALNAPLWAGTALLHNVSQNPAAQLYTNTVWELISNAGAAWFGIATYAIQRPYLDLIRILCFVAGGAWILSGRGPQRGIADASVSLWIIFCLTASWVWPWYFVPAIALAAVGGRTSQVRIAALTIGGLFFWACWPEGRPWQIEWLYSVRALVLFGPILLTLLVPRVRLVLAKALGLT